MNKRARDPLSGPASGGRRNRWRWAILIMVLAGVAAWALGERWRQARFQWSVFAGSFLDLRWGWIAAAIALALLTYVGRAVRWAVMLKPLRPKPRFWGLLKDTTIGFTAVVLLGRPGEFVRPYLISLHERVPFSSQLAAWLLERICDLLAVILIFGVALTQVDSARLHLGAGLQWALETGGYVLGIIGALSIAILVMLGGFSATVERRISAALEIVPVRYRTRARRTLSGFLTGTAATQGAASASLLIFYTLVEWTVIALCFVALFKAYPATASFGLRETLIFMGFVAFGSVLQIPGVGGGVQIVSVVVLTQMFGVPIETATSFALMLWITTFIVVLPAGLVIALREGLNWRRLRQLDEEAIRRARDAESQPLPAESQGDFRL